MMNSVAPVWDGNETWLVLGGGGLFAVFPLAYAVIMPALYAPIIAMLLGLIFRGVAFEFRWQTQRGKFLWDWAFAGGSTLAAFAQGVALGALVQGIPVERPRLCRRLVGLADAVQPAHRRRARRRLRAARRHLAHLQDRGPACSDEALPLRAASRAVATLGLIGVVSLWTPFLNAVFMRRWFAWPQILFIAPVPLLVALAAFLLFRGLAPARRAAGRSWRRSRCSCCPTSALRISFYPYHRADLGHDLGGRRAGHQPRASCWSAPRCWCR